MSATSHDGYEALRERIDSARRAWHRTAVAENAFKFVALFGGALFILALVASAGTLPGFVRWLMLLALVAVALAGAALFLVKPLLRRRTDEEVAVHVESRFPELDNAVINSLQLARDPLAGGNAIVDRIVTRTEEQTRGVRFNDAVDRRPMLRFGAAAATALVALGIYAFAFSDLFARAMQRILLPSAYVPALGNARILEVKPGSATVVAGDPVPILVKYRKTGGAELDGTLVYQLPGSGEIRREMKPVGADQFLFTFPEVRSPFSYRVNVGGTESELFAVRTTERPAVTRIDLAYQFPAYTRAKPVQENDSNGDIKALTGSHVALTLTANKAIRAGAIQGYGPDIALAVDPANPRILRAELSLGQNGSYTVRVEDTAGVDSRSPVIHRVVALPDNPPAVRVTLPGKDITAQPGDKVNIAFTATDDYGLVSAELLLHKDGAGSAPAPVARWTEFADPKNVQQVHSLLIDPKVWSPGDTIEYLVQVTDNRSVPGAAAGQTTASPRYLIKVEDRRKLADEKVKSLKSWQDRLQKVLEEEQGIRTAATALETTDDPARFNPAAAAIAKSQADARTEVLRIAGDVQPSAPDLRRIKDVLYALAANEMADAVKRAEQMSKTPAPADKKAELAALEKGVDKIIASIQKLLDILPKLEEQAKKEAAKDEGIDLSNDTKDKLKELEKGLKDFVEEQKKVIDATQELAQKNVDDFTKEDDKKLKDLAAVEDKWSQFMIEKHSDLSKLPEQDLANSSLLKELLEVQSEIKMAKDALAQKAKEIATALEDNGLELAEKLTTHIEKWLPDTPDRDQWKMEEQLGDGKTPMAELPKELEDLVGDLMENEEDLTKDVEDATAGYADSLDKGAGWDAMDGPMSNMSAQGVTGNRLPNTSEIGGRSGEGRSGKSGGEFVEEEATGKGGRKTPTRLTPDAFEKGQVDDKSKDSTGGSTGGGKASGAGAGGLEGPIPPQVQAKLKNLAARQAELRNTAEKINAQFKVMSWPSRFDETVEAMKQNEDDLKNARYQNVLRRRPVILKNLKGSRMFLEDEVKVSKDYSSPLPKQLQDDILDTTQGGTPRGYEQLLQDYYKSISQQAK